MMSTEQAAAFAQLRALAAPGRLRVRPDAEGWPMIPARLGRIEWYCNGQDCHGCPLPGEPALAVHTDRPKLFPKLWVISGVRRWQTGDREMRAVFPAEALASVAAVIRARRRRVQSPAQTQNLAKGPRSAGSRPQERAEAETLDLETSSVVGGEQMTENRGQWADGAADESGASRDRASEKLDCLLASRLAGDRWRGGGEPGGKGRGSVVSVGPVRGLRPWR
jgi:hypothetical protein